jgi:type I restriction enzyme S subunit
MTNECVLKDLIDFSRDGEWGKSETFDEAVEMAAIRGTDFESVREGNLSTVPTRYIRKVVARHKTLMGAEILIEAAGGSKDQITGRTIFLKPTTIRRFGKPVTCASFSRFIRLKESKGVDKRYVFWYLQYLYHAGFMNQYHTQHTGVSRFQWTTFSERAPLRLPSLSTQRKISAILSTYDDLIENNQRRIKILEEMAQSLYREWFVKFRFPGHEKVRMVDSALGRIPKGWHARPIGEIVQTMGGGTPSTKSPEFWQDGDVIWFTPSDLTASGTMFISDSAKKVTRLGLERSSARLFPAYSVMMTSRATIGVTSINTKEACTNQGFIICIPNERISMFQILFWIAENKERIVGVASGATYKEINRSEFREFPILVPPPVVNRQFVNLMSPLCGQVEILQAKNINLRLTRDLLLPKLISGELDISELDIKVPEEAA